MPDDPDCPGCGQPDLAFAPHDHARCADDLMALAEAQLVKGGQRLTPVRRRTLEILLEAHRALGAYDVLERLARDGFGNQPPVAYRALEFLEDQGLAHRIRRLNAFTACMHPGETHAPAFLICRACHAVAEAPGRAVGEALACAAHSLGFTIERSTVEALGLCPGCRGAGPDAEAASLAAPRGVA
ncbi:transcriptional repressor [bacterium]|nr:transcriptional repressor [bacterium]